VERKSTHHRERLLAVGPRLIAMVDTPSAGQPGRICQRTQGEKIGKRSLTRSTTVADVCILVMVYNINS
jgi:hypothetical protein